jgi:phage tail protein X
LRNFAICYTYYASANPATIINDADANHGITTSAKYSKQ